MGYLQRDVRPSSDFIFFFFRATSNSDNWLFRLDYAGPEILRGERYTGPPQDVWAFGILSYVLLTGECPFSTPASAALGLLPDSPALLALQARCADGHEDDGREEDRGGRLGDAEGLVRACLNVEVGARPGFEKILACRYLRGGEGVGPEEWDQVGAEVAEPLSPASA